MKNKELFNEKMKLIGSLILRIIIYYIVAVIFYIVVLDNLLGNFLGNTLYRFNYNLYEWCVYNKEPIFLFYMIIILVIALYRFFSKKVDNIEKLYKSFDNILNEETQNIELPNEMTRFSEKLNKIKQIKQIKNKKRIIAIVSLILILIVIIVVMFLLDKQYKTFGGSISEVFEINTNNKTNNTLSNEEDKQKQEAIKVAKKKFNELGENVEENNLEVLKIQRKGELYYYISSKDNTLEIRIKDNKITRVNSVPVE